MSITLPMDKNKTFSARCFSGKKGGLFSVMLVVVIGGCLLLSGTAAFALDQQGKAAGTLAGEMFNSWLGGKSGIKSKLAQPLTNKGTQLQSVDGQSSGQATAFCGTGNVQNEKLALRVTVSQGSVKVESDTNGDGTLDATSSFTISQVCIDGYKSNTVYYKWAVSPSGNVSSMITPSLNGCVSWNAQPPTYSGGAVARLYADATGRSITNSSYLDTTATYYAGTVTDCNGQNKTPPQTKYLNNPYSINDDALSMAASCSASDPTCQAYSGVKSGAKNLSGGSSGDGTSTCTITRNIIDAKGPQNGNICESNKSYYPTGYSDSSTICYKTAGDSWDYTSALKARCNSYGKELTLEGWASWEGAPCGTGAKFPPLPQVTTSLSYGGSSAKQVIGQFSVNRRMAGSNVAYNDQDADIRCYSDVTPLKVNLSHSCTGSDASCTYAISIDNAPACASFSLPIAPPVGETFDNGCKSYEDGCTLKDEWWYDATGKKVQTFANGASTNNFLSATCKTFAVVGSVCKDWWRKDRIYSCTSTGKKYQPDITRAETVIVSADNSDSNTIKYAKSPFNKENTNVCIGQISLSIPSFAGEADCKSKGGSISCTSPYSYSALENKCTATPVCSTGTYNIGRHICEEPPAKICPSAYLYNQASDRCIADPICAKGAFSSNSDACELPAVPTCTSPLTYNSTSQLCERQPSCSSGTFDTITGTCQTAVSLSCQSPFTLDSASKQCVATPACSAGTYSSASNMCEQTPQPVCTSPYTYDSAAKTCVTTPTCSAGTFNSATNLCETTTIKTQYQCPSSGQIYATSSACTSACKKTADCTLSNGVATCPLDRKATCSSASPPTCSVSDSCTSVICPVGTQLTGNVCTAAPLCSGSGVFNATTHKCGAPSTGSCPSGMQLIGNMCQKTADCTSPSIINPVSDKCETAPAMCQSGQQYDSANNICTFAATCQSGTIDISRKVCTAQPSMCQSGFTYESGVCRAVPSCASGGVFAAATDKCEAVVEPCNPGFQLNKSLNICEKIPGCGNGGKLNIATYSCEMDAFCIGMNYPELQCKYRDTTNKSGLYCAIDEYPQQPFEVKRRIYRDCIENKQCDISCVIQIPDASQESGYTYEKRLCTQPTSTTYQCPSGGMTVQKQCDCIIDTWDPKETRGEDCEISCIVKSAAAAQSKSNVKTNYTVKPCNKTTVNNQPKYTCSLASTESLYQDCGCPDGFGLTAGIVGSLVEAVNDRECQ